MKINHTKSGFTLIELLVVISIIALLSSVVMSGVAQAKGKARDSKRLQEFRQIDTAIQLYIADNGHAPYLNNSCAADDTPAYVNSCIANANSTDFRSEAAWIALQADLAKYLPKLPLDPCPSCGATLGYTYVAPAAMKAKCENNPACAGKTIDNTSTQVCGILEKANSACGPMAAVSTFIAEPVIQPSGSSY